MNRILLGAAAASVLMIAGSASAGVTVIGGGLAESCSRSALAGRADPRAEQTCTQAIDTEALDSRDRAGTYINRGILKMRRKAWDAATADFNEAMRLRPEMGEAYVNRGAVAIGQHQYAQSLPDLNKGLALGVEEPAKVYFNRALAYEGLDDMKSAYFDYQKALELSPDWEAPRSELARFHVERRE